VNSAWHLTLPDYFSQLLKQGADIGGLDPMAGKRKEALFP
jgi:hypothetical protein